MTTQLLSHPQIVTTFRAGRKRIGARQVGPGTYPGPRNSPTRLREEPIKESAIAALQVCLTLYFLFYFLRDRVRVLKAIRSFSPLTESETDTLFGRVNDTVHATLYGMLALSELQGLLAGLMFWWLGVPSPWFWALVAAVFAFVPVVDTFVLWLPAAVYLGLEGRWGEALGVAALGTLLVRALENFLYPVLVRHRLKVPAVGIFIALVGGLLLFGWSGLVLGPVVLAITIVLLGICRNRIGEAQSAVPSPVRPRMEAVSPDRCEADAGERVPDLPLNPGKLLTEQRPQA